MFLLWQPIPWWLAPTLSLAWIVHMLITAIPSTVSSVLLLRVLQGMSRARRGRLTRLCSQPLRLQIRLLLPLVTKLSCIALINSLTPTRILRMHQSLSSYSPLWEFILLGSHTSPFHITNHIGGERQSQQRKPLSISVHVTGLLSPGDQSQHYSEISE